MQRASLNFTDLKALWNAAQTEEPLDAVRGQLAHRNEKAVRAAFRVFECLHDYQRDGHPVIVLSPAEQVDEQDRLRGVLPVRELPLRARVVGYGLGEPALLRLMAVHNHLLLARDDALPTAAAHLTSIPRLATQYPANHEGTLLQVRDRLAGAFYLDQPSGVVSDYLIGRQERDLRFLAQQQDFALDQLRLHTSKDSVWKKIEHWRSAVDQYMEEGRRLGEQYELRTLEQTGMAKAYSLGGGESYGPNSPPSLLRAFLRTMFDYSFDLYSGRLSGPWTTQILPFGDGAFKLVAGAGNHQDAALGPYDKVTKARDVQISLLNELVRSSEVKKLQDTYNQLLKQAEEIRTHLRAWSRDKIMQGTCWGCTVAD